jgi:hypothetical protein
MWGDSHWVFIRFMYVFWHEDPLTSFLVLSSYRPVTKDRSPTQSANCNWTEYLRGCNQPPLFVDWGSTSYHYGCTCAFSKYAFHFYKMILLCNSFYLYSQLLHFKIFFLFIRKQLKISSMFLSLFFCDISRLGVRKWATFKEFYGFSRSIYFSGPYFVSWTSTTASSTIKATKLNGTEISHFRSWCTQWHVIIESVMDVNKGKAIPVAGREGP